MTRDTDMTTTGQATDSGNPATLVSILVAARRSGDRELERYARDRLRDHGIRVAFARQRKTEDSQK
jgi:hypothetical protein